MIMSAQNRVFQTCFCWFYHWVLQQLPVLGNRESNMQLKVHRTHSNELVLVVVAFAVVC